MENASKALIMAASVLIAIIIIGALVLMFNNLNNYQQTNTQGDRDAQVVEFNNQYETYNRKNVRGSDLYSLLNRVVDYNRRKSEVGTEGKDQGQYLAYEPMTIRYTLDGKQKDLTFDETNQIFTFGYQDFTLEKANTNQFETQVKNKVNGVMDIAKNEKAMQNLASGISNLFDKSNNDEKGILSAISLWNANVKNDKKIDTENKKFDKLANSYNSIINTNANKEKVYTYYEFMQFKRARFDCTDVKYNNGTGRITEMSFKFTGKFN